MKDPYEQRAIERARLEIERWRLEAEKRPSPPPILTVTTGYLIRQVYSDGSEYPVGRRRTIRRAKDLRDSCKSHFGNHFKIVRLYRKVRASK